MTSTTYNALSQATAITFGSSDNDSFTFDPNTGRMTQYQYNVGTGPVKTVQGGLTWNANGTLKQLAITDPLNAADTQTCNYGYDDLARVASANCGSPWAQTFSFDPFSNINKSGSITFNASYILSGGGVNNQIQTVSSSPVTYDGNGNITNDTVHTYTWNVDGNMVTVDSGSSTGICFLYDALNRMAEQQKGSTCSSSYQEIVYGPMGKLALMNASTLTKAFVALPAGAEAVYTSSGLAYYRHADWLGSSRLATTTSRTLYYSVAYAPFGENYAGSGTQDLSFTGQNQDTKSSSSGGAGGLYDFLYREHTPVQGRWLSPDPAGLAAVNPMNPQSWNRYAYVTNNPLALIDPLGLIEQCPPGSGPGAVWPDGTTSCGWGALPFDPYTFIPVNCGYVGVSCADGPNRGGGGGGGSDPGPPRLQRNPAKPKPPCSDQTARRVAFGIEGALNVSLGELKTVGFGVLGVAGVAGAPETGGASLVATALAGYGIVSAQGQVASGAGQLVESIRRSWGRGTPTGRRHNRWTDFRNWDIGGYEESLSSTDDSQC